MSKVYDIIVIGCGKDGQEALKKLALVNKPISIACLSKKFYGMNELSIMSNIEFYQEQVVYLSYLRGLICITTASKKTYFCKNLLITTGTIAKKQAGLPQNNVYYNGYEIPKDAKNKQAIVAGEGDQACELALATAKKFKYVYFCTKTFDIAGNAKNVYKLENTPNIVHLPNCFIAKYKLNKEGGLAEVTLNTFEALHTSYIFVASERTPDTDWITKQIVPISKLGGIAVDKNGITTNIPTIYAAGDCTDSSIKPSKVVKKIITLNKWGE